jgi:hypothetical protein
MHQSALRPLGLFLMLCSVITVMLGSMVNARKTVDLALFVITTIGTAQFTNKGAGISVTCPPS